MTPMIARTSASILVAIGVVTCTVAQASPLFTLESQERLIRPMLSPQGTIWAPGEGRFEGAALRIPASGMPEARSIHLFDEPPELLVPGEYRLETWIKSEGSAAEVRLILDGPGLSADPKEYVIARVEGGSAWHYGALDLSLTNVLPPVSWNIKMVAVGGTAWVSDLKLCASESLLGNGDFGRAHARPAVAASRPDGTNVAMIPDGWQRMYRVGDIRQAVADWRREDWSEGRYLSVQKTEGELTLSAEPVELPRQSYNLVARMSLEVPTIEAGVSGEIMNMLASVCPEAALQTAPVLTVRQYGFKGLVAKARADQKCSWLGAPVFFTQLVERHPDAHRAVVSLEFPRQAGSSMIRECRLEAFGQRSCDPRILTDQVGYESDRPMRFVVRAEGFPSSEATFSLVEESGPRRYEGVLSALGRCSGSDDTDWGAYFFEGKIDRPEPGCYALHVIMDDQQASAEPIVIGPNIHVRETGELACKYYFVQRCGCAVPGWHGPCHLDDGRLPDGQHADVSGGYHNAGDYGKWLGENTPTSVYAMVAAYRIFPELFNHIDRDGNRRADILDEAEWGAQWLLKMVNPKTGHLWAAVDSGPDYFGIPELETDGIPGNADDRKTWAQDDPDLGAFSMASWAALSRLGGDYRYLSAAEALWSVYAQAIRNGYNPRHMFAAIELHKATGKTSYLSAADQLAEHLLQLQNQAGWYARGPGGEKVLQILDEGMVPAALAFYLLERGDAARSIQVRDSLQRYFAWSMRAADNPFGIIRNQVGGQSFFFMARSGMMFGNNSQYLSTAWAALLAAQVFHAEPEFAARLIQHADNHVHWILGGNPLGLCMFEGKGNSAKIRYHHRYADIPGHERGEVPGTIPNGLTRTPDNQDRPWFDLDAVSMPAYGPNESWLVHNAYYLLMLSASGGGGAVKASGAHPQMAAAETPSPALTATPRDATSLRSIENDDLRVQFDPSTGGFVSIWDKHRRREYIAAPDRGLLLRIIVPEGDLLAAHVDAAKAQIGIEGHCATIRYALDNGLDATVHIALEGAAIDASLQLVNRGSRTVEETVFPWIRGLARLPEGSLVMPTMFNRRIDPFSNQLGGDHHTWNELSQKRTFRYPAHLASAWLDYSGGDGGLALEGRHKDYSIMDVYVHAVVQKDREPVRRTLDIATAHPCRVKPGETWTASPVRILVHGGDWHAPAAAHRDWLETWVRKADRPARFAESIGWHFFFMKHQDGTVLHTYADLPQMAEASLAAGCPYLLIFGWQTGGHDNNYMYRYVANPSWGGADALREAVRQVRSKGAELMPFYNGTLANIEMPEHKEFGHRWEAITRAGHPVYAGNWARHIFDPPTRDREMLHHEICPCEEYRPYFLANVRRIVQEYGWANLQLDQISEKMFPCYNPLHTHSRPDLAYVEGFSDLLPKTRAIVRQANPEGIIIGEWMNDFTAQWCDSSWSWTQTDFPEPVLYSLPWAMLSHEIDANEFDQANKAFAYKMHFDMKIDGGDSPITKYPKFAAHVRSLAELRRRTRDYCVAGSFRDQDGLRVTGSPDVPVKSFEAPSGRVGIVVAETSGSVATVTVESGRVMKGRMVRIDSNLRSIAEESPGGSIEVELQPFEVRVICVDPASP